MPDRRQGDRRESSTVLQKKFSISLGPFISIIVIILLSITSLIISSFTYIKGYDNGYSEGYSDALYDTGYVFKYEEEATTVVE